jgi:hypothetical protein
LTDRGEMTVRVWHLAAALALIAFVGGMFMLGKSGGKSVSVPIALDPHRVDTDAACFARYGAAVDGSDVGSLPVRPTVGYYAASFRDGTEIDVTYSRTETEAKSIASRVAGAAMSFGASEEQVKSVIGTKGPVTYWWTGDTRSHDDAVQGCIK